MANHQAKGRPRLNKRSDCKRLSLSVDTKTMRSFEKLARQLEISKSELFRQMVSNLLNK